MEVLAGKRIAVAEGDGNARELTISARHIASPRSGFSSSAGNRMFVKSSAAWLRKEPTWQLHAASVLVVSEATPVQLVVICVTVVAVGLLPR